MIGSRKINTSFSFVLLIHFFPLDTFLFFFRSELRQLCTCSFCFVHSIEEHLWLLTSLVGVGGWGGWAKGGPPSYKMSVNIFAAWPDTESAFKNPDTSYFCLPDIDAMMYYREGWRGCLLPSSGSCLLFSLLPVILKRTDSLKTRFIQNIYYVQFIQ